MSDRLPDLERGPEFVRVAGLRISEAASDHVEGWIDVGPEHHTPWGIVHGGVWCSAVETAASIGASLAAAERDQIAVGVTNITNFLRPVRDGRLRVTARAIQQGRTQQLWNVDVLDGSDRLVATGQLRLQNVAPPG